jgi:hypothetical protein
VAQAAQVARVRGSDPRAILVRVKLLFAGALLLAGCTDLDEFRGSFSGVVVGGVDEDDPDCTDPDGCSFIRRGFPSGMTLDLGSFVPPPNEGSIGTLTTTGYGLGDPAVEAFTNAELHPIPVLEHDQLSLYDFPGAVRVRNYIFVAQGSAAGPIAGQNVMVFVSLIDADEIEVRLFSGAEPDTQHFGLFRMKRR